MSHSPEPKPARSMSDLGDGSSHGLAPLQPLDLDKIDGFSSMLSQMRETAFGGRQLGAAADILEDMVADPDCLVVGTVSGAMTVAQMGLVLADMLSQGMLDCLVCTGALVSHGFIEEAGHHKFRHDGHTDDQTLFQKGYNRIYDSIELEQSFDQVGFVVWDLLDTLERGTPMASHELCAHLGKSLAAQKGRGILQAAAARNVPVYIPALSDSELGLLIYEYNDDVAPERGKAPLIHDPFRDLDHYKRLLTTKSRLGIFTIGGGVPRNWAQQVGPLVDAFQRRKTGVCSEPLRFRYGVRICPEPAHWGGLSGCSYSEGVSWGKFLAASEGGRFAEVFADATIAWPIVVKAVQERLAQRQ